MFGRNCVFLNPLPPVKATVLSREQSTVWPHFSTKVCRSVSLCCWCAFLAVVKSSKHCEAKIGLNFSRTRPRSSARCPSETCERAPSSCQRPDLTSPPGRRITKPRKGRFDPVSDAVDHLQDCHRFHLTSILLSV
uniref:Uncharacterized protein n=1 Tax=Anopheles atroparvus TaxID=41427 RepID=A0AAG5DMH3_ANOAO